MYRSHDDGKVYIFDYSYDVGSGKNSRNYSQTVVAFQTPHLQLPYFALYPESFFSFIGELVGYNDIDFASHPSFSRYFKLSGRDEMNIRHVFQRHVLSFFETIPKIRVDGGGNYLFIHIQDQTIAPENLNAFCAMALNIYNLFRR